MKNILTSIAREGNAEGFSNTGEGISQHEALIIAEQFSQVRTSRLDGVPVTNGWMLTPGEDRAMTVKRNRRTEECPVDSQGVSAPREFAERTQNSSKPRRPREKQRSRIPLQ